MAKNKKNKQQNAGAVTVSVVKGFFTFLGRSILTLLMVGAITGSIVAVCILIIMLRMVDTNNLVEISKDRLSYTSIMYATDYETGEEYELTRIFGKENRIWADLKDISPNIQEAVVAIEDKRFYEHNGVDFIRTSAAAINLVIPLFDGQVHGGSTLTQQLIKNITGEDAARVERKVQEIFSAMNVDKNYSKETILEAYLNTISLGNNTNGVEAASRLYFGKSASELTLAESAMLVGITKNPTKYDPSRRFEDAKKRQEDIIDAMWKQGKITEEEMNKAFDEKITIVMDPEVQSTVVVQSYFVDHVINSVIDGFMEAGYTEKEAKAFIYNKGTKIYTTIDERIQKIVDDAYANYNETFSTVTNEEPVQSAFVITDTHGKVLAQIGGTGTKYASLSFNRATMPSKSQPGSTIKPFTSYGLGIEYNLITYSTLFEDKALNIIPGPGQPAWNVTNYYNDFYGWMTVDTALQRSTNTIAVQVQDMVGIKRAASFLQDQVGITTISDADLAPSPIALGSLTLGVTPLEWAGAYQIYANGGTYTKPYCYTKVTDAEGNVLLESNVTEQRVISEATSMIMNQLLQNVVYGPNGTGSYAKNITGTRVAGKTGTSDKDYNQWFAGMTPDYVGVVWLGYDRNKTVTYSGGYPPPIVWTKIMAEVQKLAPEGTNFPVSSDVVQLTYCTVSGNLASDSCTSTAIGYYKSSYRPPLCTSHNIGNPDGENPDGEGSGIEFEHGNIPNPNGNEGDIPTLPTIPGLPNQEGFDDGFITNE